MMREGLFTKLTFIFMLLGSSFVVTAQQKPSFIADSLNVIHDNNGTLSKVFEQLQHQKDTKTTSIIPFLHIGDSHTQAGFFTRIIRTHLQKVFGNAGLGLVVPLKIAGTNQPRDYRITSEGSWDNGRMATRSKDYDFGISGIAIRTLENNITLNVEARHDSVNNINYQFNKITVFHDNVHFLFPTDSTKISSVNKLSPSTYSILLTKKVQDLSLHQLSIVQTPKTIHAFSLENGDCGVLYHTVGVNGARFRDFCNAPLLIEQSQYLAPKVIIISLGTNESIEIPCNIKNFLENLDCLVKELKRVNPSAVFILTTPAENYRRYQRKKIPNERIILIRDAIVEYAENNSIAYWDLYTVAGGKDSNKKWLANGLMGRDQIHFSIEGYELQGLLFFEAFMKSYHTYVGEHRLE